MTPFSPLTYISRNRGRVISIILILACTCVVFMGGMYIDNIGDTCIYGYEEPSQYAVWYMQGNNNDIIDERSAYIDELDELLPECAKNTLAVSTPSVSYKSIMGFKMSITGFFMRSREDFNTFVEYTDILPQGTTVSDGGLIISEWLANNWGVKEGDVIKGQGEFEDVYFPVDMRVEKVLPLKGIQIYGWSSEINGSSGMILPTEKGTAHDAGLSDALNEFRQEIKEKYPHITVTTNETLKENVNDSISFLTYIFWAIILIVAVVFAVTVNATFAAMYDKRKYEFSIYKAVGFSKGKIFGKIFGELLAMDGLGLLVGGTACFVIVSILNELLWDQGQHLIRPSVLGIIGTLICNLAIIAPVLLSNMRRVRKYDVTVY